MFPRHGGNLHGSAGRAVWAVNGLVFYKPALVVVRIQLFQRGSSVVKVEVPSIHFFVFIILVKDKNVQVMDIGLVDESGIGLGAYFHLHQVVGPEGDGEHGRYADGEIFSSGDGLGLPSTGERKQYQNGYMQDSFHIS